MYLSMPEVDDALVFLGCCPLKPKLASHSRGLPCDGALLSRIGDNTMILHGQDSLFVSVLDGTYTSW